MFTIKKDLTYYAGCFLIGSIFAFIVWLFLRAMHVGTTFIWAYIPATLDLRMYPIIICLAGGLILGLVKLKFGETLYEIDVLIKKVKNKEELQSENIIVIFISALIPIMFGGSIGPEAGLCCIIIVLCLWLTKYMSFFNKNIYEIYDAGINSVFTLIFLAPLYGLVSPIENPGNTKKKMYSNIICIFGALLVFYILRSHFGGSSGFPYIGGYDITNFERIFAVPLAIIGSLFGVLYLIFDKYTLKLFERINFKYSVLVTCLIGGLLLGISGTFLPLTMFSGQMEMKLLIETYAAYSPLLLIVIAVVKLIITNICIKSGWKGGHFFPVIFCGFLIGCAFSLLLDLNMGFTVAIVIASILGVLMKKPIAVALLLLLCFNPVIVPWIVVASFIGSVIPTDWIGTKTDEFENSVSVD